MCNGKPHLWKQISYWIHWCNAHSNRSTFEKVIEEIQRGPDFMKDGVCETRSMIITCVNIAVMNMGQSDGETANIIEFLEVNCPPRLCCEIFGAWCRIWVIVNSLFCISSWFCCDLNYRSYGYLFLCNKCVNINNLLGVHSHSKVGKPIRTDKYIFLKHFWMAFHSYFTTPRVISKL